MHINLESDYAVRIVQYLAQSNERRDAQSIADSTCVSLLFTLKIMRKLVAADIVQSFKGCLLYTSPPIFIKRGCLCSIIIE